MALVSGNQAAHRGSDIHDAARLPLDWLVDAAHWSRTFGSDLVAGQETNGSSIIAGALL